MALRKIKNAAIEVIFSKVAFSQLFSVKPYIFAKRNPPQLYQSQGGLMVAEAGLQFGTAIDFYSRS